MLIQRLESKERWQAFLNAPARVREKKEAGGLFHEQYTAGDWDVKKDGDVGPASASDRGRTGRMREIFHTKNAYGRLTLSMDENADAVFTVTRKVHADVKSTEQTEREVEPSNARNYDVRGDVIRTNVRKPAESAYSYVQRDKEEGHSNMRAKEIVSRTQEFARATGQHAATAFVPQKDTEVGKTKERGPEELKLEHQLTLAIELGERRMNREKWKDAWPPYIKGRTVADEKGAVPEEGTTPEEGTAPEEGAVPEGGAVPEEGGGAEERPTGPYG